MEITDRKQLRVLILAYYYDKCYDNLLAKSDFYRNIPGDERNNAEIFLVDEGLVEGRIFHTRSGPFVGVSRINSRGVKIIEDIAERRYDLEHPTAAKPQSKSNYLKLFYNQCIQPNSASICKNAMTVAISLIPNL